MSNCVASTRDCGVIFPPGAVSAPRNPMTNDPVTLTIKSAPGESLAEFFRHKIANAIPRHAAERSADCDPEICEHNESYVIVANAISRHCPPMDAGGHKFGRSYQR